MNEVSPIVIFNVKTMLFVSTCLSSMDFSLRKTICTHIHFLVRILNYSLNSNNTIDITNNKNGRKVFSKVLFRKRKRFFYKNLQRKKKIF